MNIDNSKAQMRKGILEYCILIILSKKPLYASDIIGELKEAQMIVVEGTLYPLLTRLKNDQYLSYRWEESLQGPPRKYYELTPTGEKFLSELELSWADLVEAIERLKEHSVGTDPVTVHIDDPSIDPTTDPATYLANDKQDNQDL